MSVELEAFLARIYSDKAARERFLANPEAEARRANLDEAAVTALCAIDRDGLALAARSYERKREQKAGRSLWRRMIERFK